MSGGPIFNQRGRLCGIICSNLPPTEPDEDHVSYVASLWPMLATPIDLNRRGHPEGVWYRTFDLIASRILLADNADLVVVDPPERRVDGQPLVPRIGFNVDLYDERGRDSSGTVVPSAQPQADETNENFE